eukprot:58333-Prymnesium_polylepis.1
MARRGSGRAIVGGCYPIIAPLEALDTWRGGAARTATNGLRTSGSMRDVRMQPGSWTAGMAWRRHGTGRHPPAVDADALKADTLNAWASALVSADLVPWREARRLAAIRLCDSAPMLCATLPTELRERVAEALADNDDFSSGPPLSGLPFSAAEAERRQAAANGNASARATAGAAAGSVGGAEQHQMPHGGGGGDGGRGDGNDDGDGDSGGGDDDDACLTDNARDRRWRQRMVRCVAAGADCCAPMRKGLEESCAAP